MQFFTYAQSSNVQLVMIVDRTNYFPLRPATYYLQPHPASQFQGVSEKHEKTKCGSNESSGHDDQFCPKIVKIGAILGYFWPHESLGKNVTYKNFSTRAEITESSSNTSYPLPLIVLRELFRPPKQPKQCLNCGPQLDPAGDHCWVWNVSHTRKNM